MKRLVRSIVSLVSGDTAGRIIGFVITVYLARVLTPAGFGIFGIALAVLSHMQLIANPGFAHWTRVASQGRCRNASGVFWLSG
jgi:O-antigen/teichoic acid export membrane protein